MQNLYQSANTSQGQRPPFGAEGVSQTVVAKSVNASSQTATVSPHHGYVKRDLLMLFILLVVMVAALIGLNLLAENTAFGDVLAKMVGRIF